MEVLDTPKRSKSVKDQSGNPLRPAGEKAGWGAAFNPPQELVVTTNGVNGNHSHRTSESPEAVDYEAYVQDEKYKDALEQREKSSKNVPQGNNNKTLAKSEEQKAIELWKLSEPIGGRMANADPVFSRDEKFLIVANRKTINVYSTSNSLLTRSIKPNINPEAPRYTRIVAYCLSPTDPNIVWVAFSDGSVFRIDWTIGTGETDYWMISSTDCIHMTVTSMESAGRRRDVVFTTESKKDGGFRITAQELSIETPSESPTRTIYTTPNRMQFLKSAKEGSVIVAASGNRVLVGRLRSTDYDTIANIRYEFRVFESTEAIKCLDVRASNRTESEGLKKSLKKSPIVDVVVGDIRGVLFVHHDLLAKLFSQQADGKLPPGISMVPRKLHWHREVVHTVKWSLDGNYIISGGTETVLVLWQLDTGKQQFLPHMSATIQNVVVSPTGTSYAIQLADNSAMILSTAELEPTANIAGIQASVLESEEPLEAQIQKIEEPSWQPLLVQRTPALINPTDLSKLLLVVGQQQEVSATKPLVMSNPFLQTFDLGSGHNISRQAFTRTSITNIDAAPSAHRISEPRVTHMKISHDGKWLATVDEWTPPAREYDFLKHRSSSLAIEQQHRREVFLKFWQWNHETGLWELVSRIDSPHSLGPDSGDAGRIFALASDPSSLRFSTTGEDGIVRTWTTKTRKRDGVVVRAKDGSAYKNWHCQHAVCLGKPELLDGTGNFPTSGSVAFSEDGSVLAAACDNEDGLLHLLDPDSGVERLSHTGLFEGAIVGMEFLGQDLIVLSNKLFVFDIVSEDFRFAIKLAKSPASLSLNQKQEMMHLAVDQRSRTFAVALPKFSSQPGKPSLWAARSELTVFHHDSPEPQLTEQFPTIVTALLPAISSEGYMVLDTAAEIHTVMKKGSQAVTALAQSTSALELDTVPDEPAGENLLEEEDVEEMEDYLPTPAATQDGVDEDNSEHPVVSQQQLSEIFDIGPSFALPPMEEMFYQVADLFLSKPLAQSV